jgi:hypothetical protein
VVVKRVTAALGLMACLAAGRPARAEAIVLTCQYSYQEVDGTRGIVADDPFTLDISDKRIIQTGAKNLMITVDKPFNFIEVSSRRITYGIRGFISNTGVVNLDITYKINRDTGIIIRQQGQEFMSGSCQKAGRS